MNSPEQRRAISGVVAMISLALLSPPLLAGTSCAFHSANAVSFGAYDVFAAAANNNGVGSLTITCSGGGNANFVVSLSTGQSNSYASRVLKSGGNSLNYNLYTTSGRTVVWGNGTGGSSTRTVPRNSTTTLSIFGKIPPRQDAAVGTYLDSISATVDF